MKNILEIDGLTVHYLTEHPDRPVHAVENVSFCVKEGESLGLVGESGCGKTATCRTILRLLAANAEIMGGEVRYKGTNLLALSEEEMRAIRGREIGMIFQEPMTALNPVLSIRRQMYEALDKTLSREEKQRRAVELLSMVGIPDPEKRLKEYIHQFSGGMRQRAMIAITLASQPKLLLADEPTTALDVTIQAQIVHLLKTLRRQLHMSLILITHDLGVVSQMCDRVVVMYAGQIMETAEVHDLFRDPRHPYTLGLMGSIPKGGNAVQRLRPIPGSPVDLTAVPTGCPFAPRCAYADERCRKKFPVQYEAAPGHLVRCWRQDPKKEVL